MARSFAGQVAVVTGASRGIGRTLALQLADQGARVALAARDERALASVASACTDRGPTVEDTDDELDDRPRAIPVKTDVADEESCRRLIGRTVEAFGRLDLLINNAGISMVARFEELDDLEPLERIMQVNYFGSVYCTYHALPYLIETRGRIVAVSSLTGLAGVPTRSGYAASKHAVAGFFDSIRIELAPLDVSVTVAYPGFVETGIRERAAGTGRGRSEGWKVEKIMGAGECARVILEAAAARKRQVVMTPRGKLGRWLKLIAPGIVDRIASRAVGER